MFYLLYIQQDVSPENNSTESQLEFVSLLVQFHLSKLQICLIWLCSRATAMEI